MARTIQQIQQQILAEKAAQSALDGLDSPSQVSIYNLWTFVIATAMFVQETLWDIFKIQLEADIADAPVGTDTWVADQSFKFQYDSSNPQIIHLTNFVPTYDVINDSLKLITRASVKTLPNRLVSVKVAKSEPPQALSNTELTSFRGYLDEISFAGVQYVPISFAPDELMVGATVYYNGQYSAIISSTTITSINNYLKGVPFDGVVRLSTLEDAIQSTPGVTDVILNNIAIRANVTAFSATTYMVLNNTEIYNQYPMYAGYAVTETTAGFTINDTITYIPN